MFLGGRPNKLRSKHKPKTRLSYADAFSYCMSRPRATEESGNTQDEPFFFLIPHYPNTITEFHAAI